jgi:hypothetical protein
MAASSPLEFQLPVRLVETPAAARALAVSSGGASEASIRCAIIAQLLDRRVALTDVEVVVGQHEPGAVSVGWFRTCSSRARRWSV